MMAPLAIIKSCVANFCDSNMGGRQMKPYDPSAEIRLAVRCGFLSRAVWNEFFDVGKARWRRCLWGRFISSGQFKQHNSSRASDVIVPNRDHPLVKQISGGEVSSPPSVAQIYHDEILVKGFLRLKKENTIDRAKFEAELKREDLRSQRYYDPNNKTKYPDLVIEIDEEARTKKIAIELELSRKEPKRYRQMMNTYMTSKQFSSVIFITELETVKTSIKSAIRETFYPHWERPVGFVDLQEWIKDPDEATIFVNEKVTSLAKLRPRLNP